MKATHEVIFRTRDLGAVKKFYCGLLGLPISIDRKGMVGFEAGALNLYFEEGEPNGAVLEFTVDNVERAKVDLTAAGCELVEEDPSIPRVYLRDPFGVLFNITDSQ